MGNLVKKINKQIIGLAKINAVWQGGTVVSVVAS